MEKIKETVAESPPQGTKVLKTPPLGGGREGLGGGLHLKLTRIISNRSCTIGVLTVEGTDFRLYTREDKRPTYDDNYIKHCLRPGVYKLNVEYGAVDIGNITVRGYWPVFQRIPWFPNACFCASSNYGCRLGRINIGTSLPNEFNLDGAKDAIKAMLRLVAQTHPSPPVREGEVDSSAPSEAPQNTISTPSRLEPITLEIIEPPEMEIHDITREQYEAQQRAEQERKEQEALEQEIYGPSPSLRDTSPK